MLSEHKLDAMAFLGRSEARWAVVCDYGKLCALREILEQGLSTEYERSNHAQVALIDSVVSLHCAKSAIVEAGHDEGLSDVI